jgi:hypothetical protein
MSCAGILVIKIVKRIFTQCEPCRKMRRGQPIKSIHQTVEQIFEFVNDRIIARLRNTARKIPVKFFRLFKIKTLAEAKYKRAGRVHKIKQEIVQRLVRRIGIVLEELARQHGQFAEGTGRKQFVDPCAELI